MVHITPASREHVRDGIANMDEVANVAQMGTGLTVSLRRDARDIQTVDSVTTHHGWYVSQIDTGHYELIVQIMPITEQEE